MASAPDATSISVRQVLSLLRSEFAPMAAALENGEFALWIGAGLSRNAPSLGHLLHRAVEAVRHRAVDPSTSAVFEPVLLQILTLAGKTEAQCRPHFAEPFHSWPAHGEIIDGLWNRYLRVLDIRVQGQPDDFVLWEAIDVRGAFAHLPPPAAAQLCIAILVLEGAVRQIASANWDDFIEQAVARLSRGAPAILQPIVDPDQLRRQAGQARLLKFHGCIVHATEDPATFRKYLVGSHTQIVDWPNDGKFAAIRGEVTAVAANYKTLVLGLSIQDANLQGVFSAAKHTHPWPWPCAPHAQGHIFCEDMLQDGQRDVLKVVYRHAYNDNIAAIEASALLRSWGEQVLIALTIKLINDKLAELLKICLQGSALAATAAPLLSSLESLFDEVAGEAEGDRTAQVNAGIALWSRALALFRTGDLPADAEAYEFLTASTPLQIPADANALAAGLGEFALALSLLQHGRHSGLWTLGVPAWGEVTAGAVSAEAHWDGARTRPLFLVRSAGEAVKLELQGALVNDDAIVIHADDAWRQLAEGRQSARKASGSPGRDGRKRTTHVSIRHLVGTSTDAADLREKFLEGVTM
jgi:hypothetical protein